LVLLLKFLPIFLAHFLLMSGLSPLASCFLFQVVGTPSLYP
jgi:hypothetical protein